MDLVINILLTILGYIPGIIHALYVAFEHSQQLSSLLTAPQVHYSEILDIHRPGPHLSCATTLYWTKAAVSLSRCPLHVIYYS